MGQIGQEVLAPAASATGITEALTIGARYAKCISENADIRWSADAATSPTAPTASVGDPIPADTPFEIRGNDNIRNILFIEQAGTASITVTTFT